MGMNAMLFYDDQSTRIWQMGFWDGDGFSLFLRLHSSDRKLKSDFYIEFQRLGGDSRDA
jgi:hypothetical protein